MKLASLVGWVPLTERVSIVLIVCLPGRTYCTVVLYVLLLTRALDRGLVCVG